MIKKVFNKYPILKEMILYGIIGLTSSTVDSLMFILFRKFDIYVLIANFLSINIGITMSFFLNTFFNFKQKDNIVKKAISFFCVGYIGLVLSTVLMYIFVTILKYNEIIIKIISVFVVAIIQFILNKLFTYKKRGSEQNEK